MTERGDWIGWVCRKVRGEQVLAVGPSSGPLMAALTDAGKTVAVAEADAAALRRLPEGGFDSVLIEEAFDASLAALTLRLLRPRGLLLVTLLAEAEEAQPSLHELLEALAVRLRVTAVEDLGERVVITAAPAAKGSVSAAVWSAALLIAEQQLAAYERRISARIGQLAELTSLTEQRLMEMEGEIEALRGREQPLAGSAGGDEPRRDIEAGEIIALREELSRAEAEQTEARRRLAELTEQLAGARGEAERAARAADQAGAETERLRDELSSAQTQAAAATEAAAAAGHELERANAEIARLTQRVAGLGPPDPPAGAADQPE